MTNATKCLTSATVCGLLGAAFALSGACGGSSGGSRTGTGGATSSGGATGTGGGTGTGGATGTGGSGTGGATAGFSCATPLAATATLTDFSDWNATTGRWGTAPGITGRIFGYHGAASTHTATVDTGGGSWRLRGTVMPGAGDGYMGGGLQFDQCATAAGFAGIQFDVAGSTGGCALELQLQTYADRPATASPAGGCASGCTSPVKVNLATSGTVAVTFSDLTGGTPSAFSAEQLVQIQWQFTIPPGVDGGIQTPCSVNMTFDNITFIH